MAKHIVTILSITALIILCMFLPFLPGRYDSLSETLSFMSQLLSVVGLLLVPVGLFWLWYEVTKPKTFSVYLKITTRYTFATLLTVGFITVVGSLGALTNYNLSFGILFLVCCFSFLTRTYLQLKRKDISASLKFNPTPLYLITIPIVVALVKFTLITTGVNFSREYAIKKCEPLITAMEAYFDKHGSYPISLQALHSDILPEIIGIKQYHYEPNGAAYNVYFRQFSDELDVEEIVMYNKLDGHAFAGHVLDILEYSGEELALRRGDRHKYKLSTPHWIYIKFEYKTYNLLFYIFILVFVVGNSPNQIVIPI